MEEKGNLVIVQIKSGTSEYSGVIDRFHGQVGKREIVKVNFKQSVSIVECKLFPPPITIILKQIVRILR